MRTGLGATRITRREEEEVMKTMCTGDRGVAVMQVAMTELLTPKRALKVNTKKPTWTMISKRSKWKI
jgi:hypothetical protein